MKLDQLITVLQEIPERNGDKYPEVKLYFAGISLFKIAHVTVTGTSKGKVDDHAKKSVVVLSEAKVPDTYYVKRKTKS